MLRPRVIDADGHFYEPNEVWEEYLDPKYRSAMPRHTTDNQGRFRSYIAGKMMPYIPMPPSGPLEKIKGAFDPSARLADMDRVGIDVMVIYPTKGLYFFGVEDTPTCVALCRAYNN